MKLTTQPSFNFEATVRAVAREVTRVTASADARSQYELPPDYGLTTDWTPRPVPDELRIPLVDGDLD